MVRGGWHIWLLLGGIVVAVAIGLAVGVLSGNRTSLTPGLLPVPDPAQPVRCTSIVRPADACVQDGVDVQPPVAGRACGRGVWIMTGAERNGFACAKR